MVRITRQRYYVNAKATHNIFRPQDKVGIEFRALDANGQPVSAEGIVKVTRDYWYEIWQDPSGQEVKGDQLKTVRAQYPIFPPPPKDEKGPGWVLKFRGYEHDAILTRTVKIGTNGLAEFSFVPEREGYYRVVWNGEDVGTKAGVPTVPVQAETTVWVATGQTTELGYQQGGVEIIVDRDTFRAGQTAPVMLVVPTNDRWVLFTTEGERFPQLPAGAFERDSKIAGVAHRGTGSPQRLSPRRAGFRSTTPCGQQGSDRATGETVFKCGGYSGQTTLSAARRRDVDRDHHHLGRPADRGRGRRWRWWTNRFFTSSRIMRGIPAPSFSARNVRPASNAEYFPSKGLCETDRRERWTLDR